MAGEKFKILKVVNHNEWLKTCPLFIVRSQIVLNNETGKTFLVNEMANIGIKAINSVVVKIECQNATGSSVGVVDNCAYQGLNVDKQAVFGGNKLFGVPDGTEEVVVIIKKIVFADNTVWNNDYLLRGIKIDNPVRIEPNDPAYDVVVSRCKDNNITPKFWPFEFRGGWRCTCAQINDEENIVCSLCGASKYWVVDNLDREDIIEFKERAEREERLRIQREEEERRRAEEEARLAAEREAEERRRAEEEARLAAEREAEERRLAEERAAEEARLAAEREAEEARLAAERAAEEARLAAEREAEEKRLAELRAIEEAKRAEEERKAAEERARLEVLNAKKEAVRQYNMQQTRKSAFKSVKLVALGVVAVIVCIAIFELIQFMRISDRYDSAQKYITDHKYEEAIKVFKDLGDYKDSENMVLETKYQYADYLTVLNKYQEAINLYTELGVYSNSAAMIPQVYLKWGNNARENKLYADAFAYYEKAGAIVDKQIFMDTTYEYADNLVETGSYEEAIEMYNKGDDRPGTQTAIKNCYYLMGKKALEQSMFDEAINYFSYSYNYEDTNELNKKAYYSKGNKLLVAKDIEGAYNCFVNAKGYEDADEQAKALSYDMALIRMEEGNINAAIILFKDVEKTEEVMAAYNEAMYKYAESRLATNIDESILRIYQELPDGYENASDRIKVIEKYIDYVGTYVCDKEEAEVKSVVVTMAINGEEIVIKANGEVLDTAKLKSDNFNLTGKGKLKHVNPDGKTYTYEK